MVVGGVSAPAPGGDEINHLLGESHVPVMPSWKVGPFIRAAQLRLKGARTPPAPPRIPVTSVVRFVLTWRLSMGPDSRTVRHFV